MSKRCSFVMRLVIGFAFVTLGVSTALAEDFYKGKIIRIIVGAPPGGGYDTYSRTIARHITKHISGNPIFMFKICLGQGP